MLTRRLLSPFLLPRICRADTCSSGPRPHTADAPCKSTGSAVLSFGASGRPPDCTALEAADTVTEGGQYVAVHPHRVVQPASVACPGGGRDCRALFEAPSVAGGGARVVIHCALLITHVEDQWVGGRIRLIAPKHRQQFVRLLEQMIAGNFAGLPPGEAVDMSVTSHS